ncbi:molybdate ABC transporter substrate-binding protein, partial [Pontiella sp.]|uniref:molybdate ABC transporter substrate-binding protein n=1 Tax=Pontiella sp. TaxID=2837462 RepID=UPI0035623AC8
MKSTLYFRRRSTNMKTLATLLSVLLAVAAHAAPTVFAAASTTDVMKELANAFEQSGGGPVRFNFASSGALARQIDAGAPADLFVSANGKWMDYLETKALLETGTRTDLARNSLVLVVPESSSLTFEGFPKDLKGRLAIGEPKSVPAGAYAQTALEALNQYDAVKAKLIKGKDVRTVLLYVARNEVDAG